MDFRIGRTFAVASAVWWMLSLTNSLAQGAGATQTEDGRTNGLFDDQWVRHHLSEEEQFLNMSPKQRYLAGKAAEVRVNNVPVNQLFQNFLSRLGIQATVSTCKFVQEDHVAHDTSYAAICELRTAHKAVDLAMCGDTLVGKFILDGGFYSATTTWMASFLAHDCPAGG